MKVVALTAERRTEIGKKATKKDRSNELIPCVMYGGEEPIHFTTNFNDIKSLLYTGDFKIAEVTIDGTTYRSIVKDWQAHPLTDEVLHIDFLRLIDGRPIKVEVPIRFTGSSPGVKVGGKLQQSVRRVKIKTTPDKLIDEVTLDISSLELGQSIRIRDIEAIDGIEIMQSPGIPVAVIEIPRALRAAEAAKAKDE